MNVQETIFTLKMLPPRESVLIRSRHGLGKSDIVRQVGCELSKETGKPCEVVDIRLSQREIGDILGMPRAETKYTGKKIVWKDGKLTQVSVTAEDVTVYSLPHWFPRDPDSCGILFLDEINRASREVQQAAFEMVLDYRLNFQEIPKDWRVVTSVNDEDDVYSVLSLDPALLDRFHVIDFRPTVPEWTEWAEKNGIHDAVTKFISKIPGSLDTPEKIEPGKVYPSRRSWEKVSKAIKYMISRGHNPLDDLNYLTKLVTGYVGSATAIAFIDFVRNDYKVLTPDDILNKMSPKMEKELKEMLVNEVSFYAKELVKYLESHELTGKQSGNLKRFYKAIPKEAASGFWHDYTAKCREQASEWYRKDKEIMEYTMTILDKKKAVK